MQEHQSEPFTREPDTLINVKIISTGSELAKVSRKLSFEDTRPVVVMTMGALHEGHCSLIRKAATIGQPVLVSIFVNPTQFAPHEDFNDYPRDLSRDCKVAEESGADLLFTPDTDEIYPEGLKNATTTAQRLKLPDVATRPGLEDAIRPNFFSGVCLVVSRLLELTKPRHCLFGEKDYQQLLVLKDMIKDRSDRFGIIEVEGAPTIRTESGLALSSRNMHLSEEQKDHALGLRRSLEAASTCATIEEAQVRMRQILVEHELDIDYAAIRDAVTLTPPTQSDRPLRALVAARLGSVRLIDNCEITLAQSPPRADEEVAPPEE